MNTCEIFYEPCKSVLQIVQMLIIIRILANTVANLTNVLRMKREHDARVTNLDNTHFVLHSTEMPIRMLANLYNRLTTTTNTFPTIRMACDWLQIYCE